MAARLVCVAAVVTLATTAGPPIHASADAPSGPPVVIVDTRIFIVSASLPPVAQAASL